jgi:riboflavin transporter FmnP
MNKTKTIISASLLAALSLILEFSPIFYKFGDIRVDLVGVPWILSTFLNGFFGGIITGITASILIAFTAPSGWIGALMKFLATMPMVLILGLIILKYGYKFKALFSGFIIALIIRAISMPLINYYFAFPLFWGVPVKQALNYPIELIIIPNVLLSIIEFVVSYLLIFKTRLKERLND